MTIIHRILETPASRTSAVRTNTVRTGAVPTGAVSLCLLSAPLLPPAGVLAVTKPSLAVTTPGAGLPDVAALLALTRQPLGQSAATLALAELERGVVQAPRSVETQRRLARWYSSHARWAEATATWRAVLLLQHDDREAGVELDRARFNGMNAPLPWQAPAIVAVADTQPALRGLPPVLPPADGAAKPAANGAAPGEVLPDGTILLGEPEAPAGNPLGAPNAGRNPKRALPGKAVPAANGIPNAARVALERGRQLMAQDADVLAERELRNAATLAPNWLEARRELARWYSRHARWPQAVPAWRDVLALAKNDNEARTEFARAQANLPAPMPAGSLTPPGAAPANNPPANSVRALADTQPRLAQNEAQNEAPAPAAPPEPPSSQGDVAAPNATVNPPAPATPATSETAAPAPAVPEPAAVPVAPEPAAPEPAAPPAAPEPAPAAPPVAMAAPATPPAAPRPAPPKVETFAPLRRGLKPASQKAQAAAWPLVERATRAMQTHNLAAALDLYQRAYALDPQNPYAANGVAEALLILKRHPEAEAAYRRNLAQRPGDLRATRGLAKALAFQRKFPEAIALLKQLAARAPYDFESIYLLAQMLSWAHDYEQANLYFRDALAIQPNNAEAWTLWGEVLTYSDSERARSSFTRALELNPGNVRALIGLANLFAWNGDYPNAVVRYGAALALDPNNVAAHVGLGDALTFSSRPADAVEHYQIALKLDPSSRAARLGLGRALVLARQYAAALPELKAVLDADPANKEALQLTALAQSILERNATAPSAQSAALLTYEKLLQTQTDPAEQATTLAAIAELKATGGDLAGARDAYDKAVLLAPDNIKIPIDYAQLLIYAAGNAQPEVAKGYFDAAQALVDDVLRRVPEDSRARILEVVIESKMGHKERAVALARRLEATEAASVEDALQLVYALRSAGNPQAANRMLTRLAAQPVANPKVALQIATAVRDAGEYDTAEALYRNLLVADPNNVEARLKLAEMLIWRKRLDDARRELEPVLAADPNNVPARILVATIGLRSNTSAGKSQAERIAAELRESNPQNAAVNVLAGGVATTRRQWADAVAAYRAAVEADPDNLEARLGLARTLNYSKQVQESIAQYQELMRRAPNDNEVKLELAKLYLDRNMLSDAEALYNQVLASQRNVLLQPGARIVTRISLRLAPALAVARLTVPRPNMASAVPRKSAVARPSVASVAPRKTTLRRFAQNDVTAPAPGTPEAPAASTPVAPPEATPEATPVPEPAPGTTIIPGGVTPPPVIEPPVPLPPSPEAAPPDAAATAAAQALAEQVGALRGLGEVRRRQQRYDEAIDFYNRALQVDNTDAASRLGLALALRAKGDYVTALSEVDRVLAVAADSAEAHVLRAQLLSDTGKPEQAKQELDTLVAALNQPPLQTYLDLARAFNGLKNYDSSLQVLQAAQKDYPQEAAVPRLQAESLTYAKRWDEADAMFQQLIQADPKDADAMLGRARVYNYSNRLETSEALYRKTLELEPDNYQALVELANILSRRGNWAEAINVYRTAIQRNPSDLATRVELARVVRYSRQYPDAEAILNQVLEADPKYAPALTERGILRGVQRNYEPAIADLRAALALTPNDINAQLGLAEVLGYAKQFDESLQLYQTVLQADPTNEKARIEYGLVLSYARRYDDALAQLDTVLQQNPQSVSAQITKADVLARAKRIPEAIALYQTVLQANPDNRRAQMGLADAYVYGKQYDAALKVYDAVLAAEPDNIAAAVARGRALGFAKRPREAVAALRPVVAANPNNLDARLALAEVLTNSGSEYPEWRREAVTQYKAVLLVEPSNVDAHLGLGRVYSYSRRYADATQEFNWVIQQQPNNEDALFGLAETQRYAGKPFDAKPLYRRVLNLYPDNERAKAGLHEVEKATAPTVTVTGHGYRDNNNVRIKDVSLAPTLKTRQGDIGLIGNVGTYEDEGIKLRRRALALLLARDFGSISARLLLNSVNYNNAPDRKLYDLRLLHTRGSRQRYWFQLDKDEVLDSIQAVQGGITVREVALGADYPIAKRFDVSGSVVKGDYSDGNNRTTFKGALYYRLKTKAPVFRVGVGYTRDDTDFFTPIYYTPRSFNSFAALADYVKTEGRLRYGISAAYPFTQRTGANNTNRPAKTLFGYTEYELTQALTVFLRGGIVRTPTFHSEQGSAGLTYYFY